MDDCHAAAADAVEQVSQKDLKSLDLSSDRRVEEDLPATGPAAPKPTAPRTGGKMIASKKPTTIKAKMYGCSSANRLTTS